MGAVSPALTSVTQLESTAHNLPGVGGVVPTDTLGRVAAAVPLDLAHLKRRGVLGSGLAGLGIVIPAESAAHDLDQQEQQQQQLQQPQPETIVGTTVPKMGDGDNLLNLANIEAVVGKDVLSDSQAEHRHQENLDNLLDVTGLVAINPDKLDLGQLLKRDDDLHNLDELVDAATTVQVDMDRLRTGNVLRRATQLEEQVGDLLQGIELAEVHPDKLGLGTGDLLRRSQGTNEDARDLADMASLTEIHPDKLHLDIDHLLVGRRTLSESRDLADIESLAEIHPDKLHLDTDHLLGGAVMETRDLADLVSLAEIHPDKLNLDLDHLLERSPMNIADVVALAEIHPDKFNLDTGRLLGRTEYTSSYDVTGEVSSLLDPSTDLLHVGQGKTLRRGESRGRERRRMEAEPYLRRVGKRHTVTKRAPKAAPPLFVEVSSTRLSPWREIFGTDVQDVQANGHFWSGANELSDYDDEPWFG